jgi:PAS domain S-box-containing protein
MYKVMNTKARRDRAQEALHEREIAFAALAKVAPVGILRFDANGRCNYVNDRWTEITGLTIDEAIGDGWRRAIHTKDRKRVADDWLRMHENGELFREEYRISCADGSLRWVLAEGAELRSYSGDRLGFIRAVTDITTHRRLEAELLEARRDLEWRVQQRTAQLRAEMSEREKLEKELLEAKENEQQRFSQDLHDGLGQVLTGILFRAVALQRTLASKSSPHYDNAAEIADLVNLAINKAHDLARGVHPVQATPDGLMRALQQLVEQISRTYGTKCVFERNDPVKMTDHSIAIHLYRIAQEALTNAMKHSCANKVTLCLERRSSGLALIVEDNGVGLPQSIPSADGRGLNIMRHRARIINATFQIRPAPRRGTIVEVSLPVDSPR